MILTHTFVKCDGCGERMLGCTDDNSTAHNRMMNALVVARLYGWKRASHEGKVKDLCRVCWFELFGRPEEEPQKCVPSGCSSAA